MHFDLGAYSIAFLEMAVALGVFFGLAGKGLGWQGRTRKKEPLMSRRSYRRLPRRLCVENLESRVLLACDVTFDDATNTLAIVGKEGRHNIEIVGSDDEIRVRCDGEDHGPFDLAKLDLARIVVDTTSDSGSDRVSFRFQDSVPELTGIDVKLGDGNDSLSLRFDDDVSTKLSLTTDLGAGNDSLSFRFDDAITATAELKIDTKLGDGNDSASFRFRDEVSGTHFINTDLGGGRNSFTYEAEEEWNSNLGLGVVGGEGRDDVSIRFREDISGSVHVNADVKNGTNLFTLRADEDWQGDKLFSTIVVTGGDGADTVKVRLDEDVAGLIGIIAPLGNGTNHLTVEFDEDWQNPQSKIHYIGGEGADVVNLRFHGEIPSGLLNLVELGDGANSFTFNADGWHGAAFLMSRPFLTVRGGADRDHIVARMGRVSGDLNIELDGGAGDDIVAATMRLPQPEAASPIAHSINAKLSGGDGNDLLALLAFGNPDAKNLTIDGGAADRDTAIATANVVVTNAERIRRVRG
jgi:hypothetical protein